MDCSPLAPLSMGFPSQDYWSGSPFPSPRDLPDPGIEPMSPVWQEFSLRLSHWESPVAYIMAYNCIKNVHFRDFPGGPVGQDFVLPMPEAQVPSLVRN